jgi:alpha-galactosidase
MKSNPIIVVIGGASLTFGTKTLRDIINHPQLDGSTVRLVDIDQEHLEIMTRLAQRLIEAVEHSVVIESTTDRKKALRDADYVLISVEVERYKLWKEDFSLPVSLGVRQVTGELGGPGGLFHSLRQIPLHLDIARDIETICPEAMVMVESNPLNRICLAMRRYSTVGQILGLCHGVEIAQNFLGKVLELDTEDMVATAAGVNHFTWILDLRLKATGADLYPVLKEKLATCEATFHPLSRKLFEVYGYFPAPGDRHIGEYIPYAWEFVGLEGPPLGRRSQDVKLRWQYLDKLSLGEKIKAKDYLDKQQETEEELRLMEFFRPRRWVDTLAFPIMAAIQTNKMRRMPAVNMFNQGTIDNLPADVFVETPGVVDSSGVHPIHIGDLPKPLAAFCRRDIDQMELTVEAAVKGDRKLVLQAMLLDPVIDSVQVAERVLDEMMKAQAEYLPQFA